MLRRAAKQQFYNTSKYDFASSSPTRKASPQNLLHYIKAFSPETRALFDNFGFDQQIAKLDKSNRLFKLVQKFSEVDLHPNVVSNLENGPQFRGTHPQVQRSRERRGGRSLHPARSHPPHGRPPLPARPRLLRKQGAVRTLYDPAAGPAVCSRSRRRVPARAQPRRQTRPLRAGLQRGSLRHLRLRHAHQGPGDRQHQVRRLPRRRKTFDAFPARNSTTCWPIRPSA